MFLFLFRIYRSYSELQSLVYHLHSYKAALKYIFEKFIDFTKQLSAHWRTYNTTGEITSNNIIAERFCP